MAASKKRIALTELRKRAAKGDLTEKELRAYFELDEEQSRAFAPAIRLRYARVDTRGKELSPEDTARLYEQATAKLKPEPHRTAGAAAPTRVLAEGDSWFNLPDFIMPKDALDVLRETHVVVSVAKWGDTIENMLEQKQYVQKLQAGTGFRHFLFSGGGNDVLGSIGAFVTPCNPGDTDPDNAPGYVKPSFATKVRSVVRLYGTLADDVRTAAGTGTVLYVHGYANAIPKKNGRYLGRRLEALGFEMPAAAELAEAIVRHMVGMFNTALKDFAASRAGIVYVDLRPKVGPNDWHSDEIHPKATGATKIANAFAAAIAANAVS